MRGGRFYFHDALQEKSQNVESKVVQLPRVRPPLHACLVFPSEQKTFQAQSLQSPDTDSYTVIMS